ncbi:hypothetical protein [Methanospirillum hungatei]|uniref:hypothetical protein n=1 Tax=Methanospirillum hungatei TaxID=2203 RepID=UPI0026EC42DD|nr:hypothetical protein [Methanospirillum hungatei]MCA1916085.1 hypothetical protein [Methanospirillum hungatei]
MTDIYERDLYGMKFAILKSPYHKKVVAACADMLGIPPMKLRRILIENLDMMMLESLAVRYDSWLERGDKEGGIKREIGYELFTTYIPIISPDVMENAIQESTKNNSNAESGKKLLRAQVFAEESE